MSNFPINFRMAIKILNAVLVAVFNHYKIYKHRTKDKTDLLAETIFNAGHKSSIIKSPKLHIPNKHEEYTNSVSYTHLDVYKRQQ